MSLPPNASTVHDGPFKRGHVYRVRQSFAAFRDSFAEGEVLTFYYSAYSCYDSSTGFFFRQQGKEELRVWDVDDGTDVEMWRGLFEEMPADAEAEVNEA
ncbi:hypothetical protein [Prosthecobacter sp.]|uniref:hypothetical protein n=1 Tax=Prosthecobacter sp. TaxID=1965333 RepID=UPI003783574E